MIWDVMQEWAQCRDAMLPAIEMTAGTHTEDDVLAMLVAGRMKLWRKGASACITEFIQYPQMKVINVFIAGGSLQEIAPLQIEIENYGRKNGCHRAALLAVREGWTRILGDNVQNGGIYAYKDL